MAMEFRQRYWLIAGLAFTVVLGLQECVSVPEKQTWEAAPEAKATEEGLGPGDVSDTLEVQEPWSCQQITRCTNERQCADEACYQTCVQAASEEARALFEALTLCQQGQCGHLNDKNHVASYLFCVYTKCKTWLQPCIPVGESTCPQVMECVKGCKFNQQCSTECLWQGTYDAQLNFVELWKCMETNCNKFFNFDVCVEKNCSDELAVCS